jgi:hypothetical protein
MEEKVKIIAVETEDGKYYYRSDNYKFKGYGYKHLIDGKELVGTFHSDWYVVDSIPNKIEKLEEQPNINYRYVLKDKSMVSNNIALEVKKEDFMYLPVDGEEYVRDKYKDYYSLYEEVSDKQEPKKVDIDFEFEVIMKVKEIKESVDIPYDMAISKYASDGLVQVGPHNIKNFIYDKIKYPEIVLPQRPCYISSYDTYRIVRQYIKQNMDYDVAKITSDFDFCFRVKKIIYLSEPVKCRENANDVIFSKRKPNYKTRYIKEREVECFEMTHDVENYKGYTVIKGFEARNQEELKEKIDNYCKDLIEFINKPLKDCDNCKGLGVVLNKKE